MSGIAARLRYYVGQKRRFSAFSTLGSTNYHLPPRNARCIGSAILPLKRRLAVRFHPIPNRDILTSAVIEFYRRRPMKGSVFLGFLLLQGKPFPLAKSHGHTYICNRPIACHKPGFMSLPASTRINPYLATSVPIAHPNKINDLADEIIFQCPIIVQTMDKK